MRAPQQTKQNSSAHTQHSNPTTAINNQIKMKTNTPQSHPIQHQHQSKNKKNKKQKQKHKTEQANPEIPRSDSGRTRTAKDRTKEGGDFSGMVGMQGKIMNKKGMEVIICPLLLNIITEKPSGLRLQILHF